MLSANLYDAQGKKTGNIDLPENIFGVRVNQHLLYLAVRNYLDNKRQGTASTQNAEDVRGGGKKPFRQKGTGRARQGSNRSSLMVGGYVAHGPHPRDYSWEMPRASRRQALKSALTDSFKTGRLAVIDAVTSGGKTRDVHGVLKTMELSDKKVLLLDVVPSSELLLSGRNIKGLAIRPVRELNAYEIMRADRVLFTKAGVEALKEVFNK
ncbi:50S ribosomal protein L4 [candidate division TA06 bacterium]|uniref:Large ribosomal subunit protein uL4 n=1 Tax=candidate division TA06 bacterium TaxID=2250710 RepID=A0A933I9N6_UNCT6|nr:50S ribosomal protein L4 [candidate division TA06 bacterium]